MIPRRGAACTLGVALALLLLAGPARAESAAQVVWVALGGETFQLEVADDPQARYQGLSGRGEIPRHAGMLFVLPRPKRFAMVMRDCPEPIDVAFLDAQGRVVAIHEMRPEPPRRPGETPSAYEERLPAYESGDEALFAVETAGGRLTQVGLRVGDRVPLAVEALRSGAR
jgi:uncharacterized membrane protein (UPF0127 family)